MHRILIVEDKASMAGMLRQTLESEGYEVEVRGDGRSAIERIDEDGMDMILTDLNLPHRDGMQVLSASKDQNPLRPVIIMTAFGSIETAVNAVKMGAFDFITKPLDIDHLLVLISRALENRRVITQNMLLRDELDTRLGMPEIIGTSSAIAHVVQACRKAAPTRTTVLLRGRSGTGKELFARAIHRLSDRADYPFVAVNCAAIPHDLLESELFGHEKGSFTGADARRHGRFELANGGTIFLDEIGEMEKPLQAKLLRVLQEGEIDRVGGTKPIAIDVRVIAASNADLEKAIEDGSFREDLYYRINVFPITIPGLSERPEDIPLLAGHFLAKYTAELKASPKEISPEAMRALVGSQWKGNVRELENAIERAVILCDGPLLMPEHFNLSGQSAGGSAAGAPETDARPLEQVTREATRKAETQRIRKALADSGGNKTKAAAGLGVSYKTLLTKIKDYGI